MQRVFAQEAGHHVYKEYPMRWAQFGLFISALISNIMFGFSLSPIVKQMSLLYSVDERWLSFLTISFSIFSVIMIIPGNVINEKYGISASIKLGCLLTFIGSCLALMVNFSFWFFFLGQLCSLVGFPFRLISASKFVANWFFPENRIVIMVAIALLFNASSGIAIRIPLFVFGDYDINKTQIGDAELISEGQHLVQILMVVLFLLMVVLCLPPLIFFQSKPKTPPSFTASDECVREDYTMAAKTLVNNKDFIILTICFPLILGTITLFTLQMQSFIDPFGLTSADQSNLVGLGVLAGLIGDISVGTAIKKTKSYKLVLRICNALVSITFLFMIIALYIHKVVFFIAYFLVCGVSAIMALSFEFACELSFPMSENTTIAMFGFFGNIVNALQGIPEILILKGDSKTSSLIALLFMWSLILSANYLTYTIEENLKRQQKDLDNDERETPSTQSISLLENN